MTQSTLQTIFLAAIAASGAVLVVKVTLLDDPNDAPALAYVPDWERYAAPSSPARDGDGSIVIIEFSDFQCPFCARAQPTLNALSDRYPGKVRVLYRHHPLAIHPHAFAAAQASECANEQGRFGPFHDMLFEQQELLGSKSWEAFASAAGVDDIPSFSECLRLERYRERIQEDIEAAREIGLTGTPGFLVNGNPLIGAQPLEAFDSLISSGR